MSGPVSSFLTSGSVDECFLGWVDVGCGTRLVSGLYFQYGAGQRVSTDGCHSFPTDRQSV